MKLQIAIATSLVLGFISQAQAADVRVIKISAKRFEFTPRQITIKKGEHVKLQLSSEDRMHGFNIPQLHVRTSVVSGKPTEVDLTPDKPGDYTFFCDVFCGNGHEDMTGKIIVTE